MVSTAVERGAEGEVPVSRVDAFMLLLVMLSILAAYAVALTQRDRALREIDHLREELARARRDLVAVATRVDFQPNPDVKPLDFDPFERGLAKPLFPIVRAWFRALWDRMPSSPKGGPR